MAAAKGMIFLEQAHPIIENCLREKLAKDAKPEPVDIRLSDFDGVQYHILTKPESKNKVTVSIQMPCLKELKSMGATDQIAKLWGSMVDSKPESGFDFSLTVDIDNVKGNSEDIIKSVSELKRNLMAAPFDKCFDALCSGKSSGLKPMMIRPRGPKEFIVLNPGSDRVMVYYAIYFEDETDSAIASVFCQEFAEAQRHVGNAPNVTYSVDAPKDFLSLKMKGFKEQKGNRYVCFQVFKSHVDGKKRDRVVSLFLGFRNYLHYHIKASKSYLHARMRSRVDSLLLVLNRANPDNPARSNKQMKTMGGKAFTRKI